MSNIKRFEPQTQELSLTDRSNPRSIINIAPNWMSNLIEAMPAEILEMDFHKLKNQVQPDVFDERIRLAFWNEYHLAQSKLTNMNMSNVYGSVGISQSLLVKTLSNSYKLAYVLTPPADVALTLQETMNFGIEQLRQILAMPHIDQRGNLDARAADVKFKITQDLINRVRGQTIQRVEVKSQNVNLNADVSAGPTQLPNNMKDLDAHLEALEEKAQVNNFGATRVEQEDPEEIIVESEEAPRSQRRGPMS